MDYISRMWNTHIDITAVCPNACAYCTRYTRHLRADQREHMSLEQIEQALQSYEGWPAKLSIMGGEPLLHPRLFDIFALVRKYFPPSTMLFYTSGIPGVKMKKLSESSAKPPYHWFTDNPAKQDFCDRLNEEMNRTFGEIYYNPHVDDAEHTCEHQPLTVAVSEATTDESVAWKLINNCWLQRKWCGAVNIHGAYFCEVAAGLDNVLFNGAHAWPVKKDWWKIPPHLFQEQVSKLCPQCGMCLPLKTQPVANDMEVFSPRLLETFREAGARLKDELITVSDQQYSIETIQEVSKEWMPANYRKGTGEYLSMLTPIAYDLSAETVFSVETDADFAKSLERAQALSLLNPEQNVLRRLRFKYGETAFDPLYDQYPFVLKDNTHGHLLYFRGMMLYYRMLLDDTEFAKVLDRGYSYEKLSSLVTEFWELFRPRKHAWMRQAGAQFDGKEVYLLGGGYVYHEFKDCFAKAKAKAIIVNRESAQAEIDGIPVVQICDMPPGSPKLPLIVMVREENAKEAICSMGQELMDLTEGKPFMALYDYTGPSWNNC